MNSNQPPLFPTDSSSQNHSSSDDQYTQCNTQCNTENTQCNTGNQDPDGECKHGECKHGECKHDECKHDEWSLFRYIAGEMESSEEARFEIELNHSQTLRERLASTVQLMEAIHFAEDVRHHFQDQSLTQHRCSQNQEFPTQPQSQVVPSTVQSDSSRLATPQSRWTFSSLPYYWIAGIAALMLLAFWVGRESVFQTRSVGTRNVQFTSIDHQSANKSSQVSNTNVSNTNVSNEIVSQPSETQQKPSESKQDFDSLASAWSEIPHPLGEPFGFDTLDLITEPATEKAFVEQVSLESSHQDAFVSNSARSTDKNWQTDSVPHQSSTGNRTSRFQLSEKSSGLPHRETTREITGEITGEPTRNRTRESTADLNGHIVDLSSQDEFHVPSWMLIAVSEDEESTWEDTIEPSDDEIWEN